MLAIGLPHPVAAHLGDVLEAAFACSQRRGPLAHAPREVAGDGLQLRRGQAKSGLQRAGLDQQNRKNETCRQQSVKPAGIEPQIEPVSIQHAAEREVEQPGDADDDQPQIQNRIRPVPQQDQKGGHAERPNGRDHDVLRRRKAGAGHQCGQQIVGFCRGESQQYRDADDGSGNPNHPPQPDPGRSGPGGAPLQPDIGHHAQREPAVPEHV